MEICSLWLLNFEVRNEVWTVMYSLRARLLILQWLMKLQKILLLCATNHLCTLRSTTVPVLCLSNSSHKGSCHSVPLLHRLIAHTSTTSLIQLTSFYLQHIWCKILWPDMLISLKRSKQWILVTSKNAYLNLPSPYTVL